MGHVSIGTNSQETMENQMTNMHDEIEQRLKELMKLKNELPKLIVDLYWEYDRMTSSGQKSLDKLARLNGVPTEREIQKTLKQYHAELK